MRSRLIHTLGWLVASIAVSAAPVTWFRPAEPGAVPGVVHLTADAGDALRYSDALRARGFAYANWRGDRIGVDAWSELLRSGEALDGSRIAIVASGTQAADAMSLLVAAASSSPDLRGLVLRIDGDTRWPASFASVMRWPSMLLTYAAANPQARASAFTLAQRVRSAGAQVWVQPTTNDDATAVAGWLAALEVKRARRFEDAAVAAYRGVHHDALAMALEMIAPSDGDDPVRAQVADAEARRSMALMLDAEGRILRGANGVAVPEFDARGALAAVFGDDDVAVRIEPAAHVLLHPETGAQIQVLPTTIATAEGVRSLLMLRHADGSYAWLDLNDARRIRAVMASDAASDHGRVWWILMDATDAGGSRVLRVALQPGEPRRGLWWDPSHPGHALDVQPIQGGHSAVFATFDAQGRSRWMLATGHISQRRFVASKAGLQLMRRDPALSAPKPDPRHAARIAVDFSVDARHPACAARKAQATQLALLSISDARGRLNWCIEPVALPAGVPDADVNGTWYGGANDSGWGLTVVASGEADTRLTSALLYYHDAEGWPRWAMGAARAGEGGAALTMHDYQQSCVGCSEVTLSARPLGELRLRASGWCAQPELRAAFEINADATRAFVREEAVLQRVTEARCH
jgi:hypothetical protein